MSDIFGPPPNSVAPLRGTGQTSAVSKDPHHAPTQGGEEKGDTRARNREAEAVQVRDPAVSISASAAHLQVGDRLQHSVDRVDGSGRPIIVTENATFALRPDAGLKPGDDVILKVTETGKTVTAELLSRNGRPIDPPQILNLTVISIHKPDVGSEGVPGQPLPGTAPGASYSRPSQTAARSDAAPETLASLLGRNAPLPPTALPEGAPAIIDPLVQRASSGDLAALIAAQQGRVTPHGLYKSASALVPPDLPGQPVGTPTLTAPAAEIAEQAAAPGHLLPPSPLTALDTTAAAAASAAVPNPEAGLGIALPAFTPDGVQKQVQLIDTSVSRVPPQQVAEVLQVRPLAPEEARTLTLPMSAFAQGALAHVDTSRGPIIMAQDAAAPLMGELIKVADIAAQAAPAAQSPAKLYAARLTPPGATQAHAVQVELKGPDAMAAEAGARIKAVHTVRAFLTPEGPKTDFRLETTSGIISLTLPNAVRPVAGERIEILPLPAAPSVPAAPDLAAAAAQTAAAAAQGAEQVLAGGWPALEAAQTLVAGANPQAAQSLANRDAGGGAKLTNSLLFFLKAAGASPEAWLGDDAARMISNKDAPLLAALKQDIAHMALMATHPAGEWRAALLPLDLRAPDMPFIALLFTPPEHHAVNKDGGGGQDGTPDEGKSQRFLVEVRFSLLGAVQLDGTIRDRQFDLTLRSEQPLSPALKADAYGLFDAALGANGFTGRLSVTEGEAFPLQVDALLASRAREIPQQQTA